MKPDLTYFNEQDIVIEKVLKDGFIGEVLQGKMYLLECPVKCREELKTLIKH